MESFSEHYESLQLTLQKYMPGKDMTIIEQAIAYAEKRLKAGDYISLGGWGKGHLTGNLDAEQYHTGKVKPKHRRRKIKQCNIRRKHCRKRAREQHNTAP